MVHRQVFASQTIRRITNDLLLGQRVTRDRAFTPEITVGLFVLQALSERCGCQKIVHEHNTTRKRQSQSQLSSDSSSYCEARSRLPIALLAQLLGLTIRLAGSALSDQWLWHERRAILVDGLVTNAPDTPANQEAFPQTASQDSISNVIATSPRSLNKGSIWSVKRTQHGRHRSQAPVLALKM